MTFQATSHWPGSAGKLGVLIARQAAHLPLFHPDDARTVPDVNEIPAHFESVSGHTEDALTENYRRFVEAIYAHQSKQRKSIRAEIHGGVCGPRV
jgi:hypothetical protein